MRIKVEYDRYNRTFKLLNKEFGPLLEDGAVYELLVPVVVQKPEEEESAVFDEEAIAHA
jgi:hypothetical protein